MKIRMWLGVAALAAILSVPSRAEAQVDFSSACSPGIPSCGSLRFFIQAAGGIGIDQLFIELLSTSWSFTGDGIGTYSAFDSFGFFSGFTTLGSGGRTLAIDFAENGFPMEIFDGDVGTLDVEADGDVAERVSFIASGVDVNGNRFETSVPEPQTILLLATGLGLLGGEAVRRRRRQRA